MTPRARVTKWQRPCPRGALFLREEQDPLRRRLVSIHQSQFVFFQTPGNQGQGHDFHNRSRRKKNNNIRMKTLNNYSSLAAPHRSKPVSSSWQRPPGPGCSPSSPPTARRPPFKFTSPVGPNMAAGLFSERFSLGNTRKWALATDGSDHHTQISLNNQNKTDLKETLLHSESSWYTSCTF